MTRSPLQQTTTAPVGQPNPSSEDIGYLAGLIDGDGTLYLSVYRRKDRLLGIATKSTVNITFKRYPETVQTVMWLKKTFGGYVSTRTYHSGFTNRTDDRAAWEISSKATLSKLLPQLVGFLKIKREQANLLCQAVNLELKREPGWQRSKAELAELIGISERISRLNRPKASMFTLRERNNLVRNTLTQYDGIEQQIQSSRGRRQPIPARQQQLIISYYLRGASIDSILSKFGLTTARLYKLLHRRDIELRQPPDRGKRSHH